MSLDAYIRYDHTGRIVPGGPIVVKDKPAVGNWQPVVAGTNVTLSGKLRAFVKVDRFGKPIASSLFLGKKQPATGDWIEVNASLAQAGPSTTTTSTTAVPGTTSTTTTTSGVNVKYGGQTNAGDTQWIYKNIQTGNYEGLTFSNQFPYYFEGALTIGTRLYYDYALTQPVELQYDGTIWFILNNQQFTVSNIPGNTTVYTVDRYGYVIAENITVDQISYRVYYGTGTGGGNWYYGEQYQAFTTDCSQYFNNAFTAPGVDTIEIGTTVFSTLSPPSMDFYLKYLSYNGNIYEITNGVVSSLVTNCGGTTTTTSTTIASYTIGQQALGGTIAYILQPGDPGYDSNVQHGLVATISDITTIFDGLFWGCSGINVNGLSSALGAGASNTDIIAATCSDSSFAAKACADLVYGGYSDWYLPSFDELTKLQQNKNLIGNFDADGRLYWSSNQTSVSPSYDALMIQFSSGDTYPTGKLSVAGQVRPVRSF